MKISCIVLAAGKSSRFEGNKLLAKWQGKSLLAHTLEKVLRCGFHQTLLVTTRTTLEGFEASLEDVEVVINSQQALGISHSIALGIEKASLADAYFFIVGDQPLLSFYTLKHFTEGFQNVPQGIGCVCFDEKMGNPTIFSKKYKEDLLGLTGDQGGKKVMTQFIEDVWCYPVSNESELQDIDTRKDYKVICKCEADEV